VQLHEIASEKRGKGADLEAIKRREGERILNAIPEGSRVVALDVKGKQWSTEQLSEQMQGWMQDGRDVALMVGGPEGLSDACLQRAEQRWSLSALTLPHPMVRIVVAEQLYRAWSIIKGHPYHR
jgi:23S rRNA (pseudouridine1915-N3)-methyltransferase